MDAVVQSLGPPRAVSLHSPAKDSEWLASLGSDAFDPADPPPREVEVAVVGGGLFGVAVAYWLARRGVSVGLVDAGRLAAGASGRNAGLLLPNSSELEDPALLRRVLERESLQVELETPGHLALACSRPCWDAFREEADRTSSDRIAALDRRACEKLLGHRLGPQVLGGRLFRQGSMLHPARLVHGLARAAVAHGARLAIEAPVLEIEGAEAARGRVELATARGPVRCRRVLLACGGAGRRFVPALATVVQRSEAQMLSTRPLPPLFSLGLGVDFGSMYWRQARSGALVLGGGALGGSTTSKPASEAARGRALLDHLAALFPDLPRLEAARRWSGVMDPTRDGRPLVGPLDAGRRIWIVAGFGGHGLPAGLAVGRRLARAFHQDTDPELPESWHPSRFEELASRTAGERS